MLNLPSWFAVKLVSPRHPAHTLTVRLVADSGRSSLVSVTAVMDRLMKSTEPPLQGLTGECSTLTPQTHTCSQKETDQASIIPPALRSCAPLSFFHVRPHTNAQSHSSLRHAHTSIIITDAHPPDPHSQTRAHTPGPTACARRRPAWWIPGGRRSAGSKGMRRGSRMGLESGLVGLAPLWG